VGPGELLHKTVEALEQAGVPYLVTGSVASTAWGEPRLTNDIDIVADLRPRSLETFLSKFGADEYYYSPEAAGEAVRSRDQFNIIHSGSGLKVDVILKKDTPFDDSRFGRARRIHPAESYTAVFAAPEDVILKKMEYHRQGGSEKHVRDILGIVRVSDQELDRDYIASWAKRLGLLDIWEKMLQQAKEKSCGQVEVKRLKRKGREGTQRGKREKPPKTPKTPKRSNHR
jgi:hypothetical protein